MYKLYKWGTKNHSGQKAGLFPVLLNGIYFFSDKEYFLSVNKISKLLFLFNYWKITEV